MTSIRQTGQAAYRAMVASILGGNVAAVRLLSHPRAYVEYVQHTLFAWRFVAGQGLPVRQLHELVPLPHEAAVTMLPTTGYITWWDATYTKDMLYLALLCHTLAPRVTFEIGTLRGYSALLTALNTPDDAEVYTLDLPPAETGRLTTTMMDDSHIREHADIQQPLFVGHAAGRKVRQLFGDSAAFDFTSWRERVDLFVIDGAHSYEYVRSDTERALTCVRPGGVILWHDYGRFGVNGVSRWLHELRREQPRLARLPGSSFAILRV